MEKIEQKPIEYRLKDDDILYFLHIPKAAGTTLIPVLDDRFDLDSIYQKHDWEQALPNLPKDFSKYKLLRGHFGYGVYRILPRKPVYITILRDPVERTISDYDQFVRIPHFKDERLRQMFQYANLAEIINDPNKKWRFTNNQTRWIALDLDPLSLTNSLDPIRIEGFARLISPEYRSLDFPDDKLLEIAKQHLSEFAFVGLTERFDDSLYLLCYTFGWKPIRNVIKHNVAPYRTHHEDLSKETIDAIKECTKQDAELYSYAQQLFEARFSQMVKELKDKHCETSSDSLSGKEVMYELLEGNYEERYYETRSKVGSIEYDFSQAIDGSGWYAREFLPDGTVFRWTGPETNSSIDFPINCNSDLKIQFSVLLALNPSILDSLRLKVNGASVQMNISQREDRKKLYEGTARKAEFQSKFNFVRLEFQVTETISPNSINPKSNDSRKLGIKLEWIKINSKN